MDGTYGDESAEVARRLDALSEALASWDRSIRAAEQQLRPRFEGTSPDDAALAHETLGSLYLERGRFSEAAAEFEAAIRLAPRRSSLYLSRAFAQEAAGNSDPAAAFRQAWMLDPDNPITAYLALTRSPLDEADLARGRETLSRTIQSVNRGARLATRTPFTHPASLDEPAGTPLFPLARYADGFARAMRGQIAEGVGRMREAAASDPLIADPDSQIEGLRQASDALRRGSLSAALAALEKVVTAFPRSSEAHRMLATAAAIGGNTRTSIEHFEAALRIRPDDERSWMALADRQIESGALVEATRTLDKAVAAIPYSGGLRWR